MLLSHALPLRGATTLLPLRHHVLSLSLQSSPLEPVSSWGHSPLSVIDPEVHAVIQQETLHKSKSIDLSAADTLVSAAVAEVLRSGALVNKSSEGIPGFRYHRGNEIIDQIETLAMSRALEAFRLDPARWGVNVQPYSGDSTIFAVCTALLKPQDRIMGLDLASGGTESHGCASHTREKPSVVSTHFDCLPYKVNAETGYIDYDEFEAVAAHFSPMMILCGGSAYPRDWDYARFRKVADKCGAVLVCDMSSVSGLVAAQEAADPFEYCDIVTTSANTTLRGPRSGMIFYRKGPSTLRGHRPGVIFYQKGPRIIKKDRDLEELAKIPLMEYIQGGPYKGIRRADSTDIFLRSGPFNPPTRGWPKVSIYDYMVMKRNNDTREGTEAYEFEGKINLAVFPIIQGAPHNHQIGALAVALKQVLLPEFKEYAKQVKANAVAVGNYLMSKGYKLATGGTDTNLVLWDLRSVFPSGAYKIEKVCELCNITVSKGAPFVDSIPQNLGKVYPYGQRLDSSLPLIKRLPRELAPVGLCIGTHTMTSRGLVEEDFEQIAEFLHQAVTITLEIEEKHGMELSFFEKGLVNNKDIEDLKQAVENFSGSFEMPDSETSVLKYKD